MLTYPSIPSWRDVVKGKPCLAFYKYDGSNLRFEWTPKKGWHKFGTRTQLFDANTELYSQALPLFFNLMSEDIVLRINKIHKRKVERIIAFAEFFGPSSFAGSHKLEDSKQLKLFDVSVYKKGFLDARQFYDCFKDTSYSAEIVYDGNMNLPFIEAIRNGEYVLNEGVVCKGFGWNAKIKTLDYLERLKSVKGDRWTDFAE